MHHVSFLVEQLSYLTLQVLDKVSSLVHFHYFFHKHGFLVLSVDVSKNIHQKVKSLNDYEIYSAGLEHTKFGCLHFTILQYLEKLSPLVHFGYSFSIAWIFGVINEIIQNDSSKNEDYKF